MRNGFALVGWLAVTFSASFTAVFVTTEGWYGALAKPAWNPPSWVFGPVWTTLYMLMALAAWLVCRAGGWAAQRMALTAYLVQLALNALWTPLFFGLHCLGPAFVEVMVLWVAVLVTLVAFWRVRRLAGLILIPYAAWTAFAAALNFAIWRLNPG